ncbi:MAG: hypothetical protein QM770_03810 [Tepidisphaeraceae bacterium]
MPAATKSILVRAARTPLLKLLRGKLAPADTVESLLASSTLDVAAQAHIRQIVKRTRLWSSEKVDVTHELVAHFRDGVEAGATSAELIESFGEVRTTAKLIRRAKVRSRSILWHARRWCLRGAGAGARVRRAGGSVLHGHADAEH